MPKGARIGAYLESLRVSGMTPEPISDESSQDTLESTKSGHTDPGGRGTSANEGNSTVMARSNSSHGGFPGAGPRPRASPLSSQFPRRLQSPSPRLPPSALPSLAFPPPPPHSPHSPTARPARDHSTDSSQSGHSVSDTASLRLDCGVSPVASPSPASSHQQQLVQEMLAATGTPPLPPSSPLPHTASPPSATPAAQLVTELFESLQARSSPPPFLPSSSPTPAFKPPLKKVVAPTPAASDPPSPPPVNFKSQLKKTNSSLYAQPGAQEDPHVEASSTSPSVVDFKSALRKVTPKVQPAMDPDPPVEALPDLGFRASLRSVSGELHRREPPASNLEEEEVIEEMLEEETKRKSTGSISSLVRMWDQSPKDNTALTPSPGEADRPGSTVKFEKRVWPPVPSTETEKPMVPVKPTVKPPPTSKPPPPREPTYKPPPKPSPAAKPQVCNIYAAPSSVAPRPTGPSKPNISSAKPKLQQPATTSSAGRGEENGGTNGSEDGRQGLLTSSSSLLTSLSSLPNSLSKAEAMAAAEQVGVFHSSCSLYVDSIPATGRFRFRSLLNKLDSQAKELRAANVTRSSETAKLVKELEITVKDVGAAIQR